MVEVDINDILDKQREEQVPNSMRKQSFFMLFRAYIIHGQELLAHAVL